jgi:KipI family sensor histidine kinase inhibitor
MASPDALTAVAPPLPAVLPLGWDGLLVRFGTRLDDAANRAALAFRAELERCAWEGIAETAPGLGSVYVRLDPGHAAAASVAERLEGLLGGRDWFAEPLPGGRRLWRVPCAFGGAAGPALAGCAEAAGLTENAAVEALAACRLRVLALGFAPGQPYLGVLPEAWDLPRRKALSQPVPAGAVGLAVRQLTLFAAPSPTGWHLVGQTRLACFDPARSAAVALAAGDEIRLEPVAPDRLQALAAADPGGFGGARCEMLE